MCWLSAWLILLTVLILWLLDVLIGWLCVFLMCYFLCDLFDLLMLLIFEFLICSMFSLLIYGANLIFSRELPPPLDPLAKNVSCLMAQQKYFKMIQRMTVRPRNYHLHKQWLAFYMKSKTNQGPAHSRTVRQCNFENDLENTMETTNSQGREAPLGRRRRRRICCLHCVFQIIFEIALPHSSAVCWALVCLGFYEKAKHCLWKWEFRGLTVIRCIFWRNPSYLGTHRTSIRVINVIFDRFLKILGGKNNRKN